MLWGFIYVITFLVVFILLLVQSILIFLTEREKQRIVFEMVGPASFYHEDWTTYGLDKSPEATAGLFSIMSGNIIPPEMIEAHDYNDEVKPISADMWVNGNTVPTLIAYGKYDKVCPFGTVQHLVNALKANNIPYDYIEFPHSGHGLQNDNKLYAKYMN